jgi:hypothetical protein
MVISKDRVAQKIWNMNEGMGSLCVLESAAGGSVAEILVGWNTQRLKPLAFIVDCGTAKALP